MYQYPLSKLSGAIEQVNKLLDYFIESVVQKTILNVQVMARDLLKVIISKDKKNLSPHITLKT